MDFGTKKTPTKIILKSLSSVNGRWYNKIAFSVIAFRKSWEESIC